MYTPYGPLLPLVSRPLLTLVNHVLLTPVSHPLLTPVDRPPTAHGSTENCKFIRLPPQLEAQVSGDQTPEAPVSGDSKHRCPATNPLKHQCPATRVNGCFLLGVPLASNLSLPTPRNVFLCGIA